jgi:hypothetical protein
VKAPLAGGDQAVADLKTKFPLKSRITRYHILEKAVLCITAFWLTRLPQSVLGPLITR